MFKERLAVYADKQMKQIRVNTLCGGNPNSLNVKAGNINCNHCAIKDKGARSEQRSISDSNVYR
jgi:hypothetical protein